MKNLDVNSERIPVAVVGLGAMGRNHARVLADLPGAQLVGVCDIDPAVVAQISRIYGVAGHTNLDELISKQRPAAIIVAVPTAFHESVALSCIERNIHVLVEKPLSISVESGERILSAANDHAVKVMTGYIERFNPAVVELKRRLKLGEAGRIMYVSSRRLNPGPGRIQDVGVILDLATHDLDLIPHLLQQAPIRVSAETASHTGSGREDVLACTLKFSDGAIATIDANWLTPTKVRELTILGEKGMFSLNYITQELKFYPNELVQPEWDAVSMFTGVGSGDAVICSVVRMEPLRVELSHFVSSITDSTVEHHTASGINALKLAAAVASSAAGQGPVSFDKG